MWHKGGAMASLEKILQQAVEAGIVTKKQSKDINDLALMHAPAFPAEQHKAAPQNDDAKPSHSHDEEPFQLFNGFSDIAIMVGLCILYIGTIQFMNIPYITGFFLTGNDIFGAQFANSFLVRSIIVSCALFYLGYFYGRKKNLAGPSNILTIFLAITIFSSIFGYFSSRSIDFLSFILFSTPKSGTHSVYFWIGFSTLASSIVMFAFWKFCRIPFALFFIALFLLGFFMASISFIITKMYNGAPHHKDWLFGENASYYLNIFIPSIVAGIVAFILALRFDARDPNRKTRDNANAFWLHAFSSIAFIHPIASNLFASETNISLFLLVTFITLIGLIALITDRRIFLLSCIGYMIAILLYYNILEIAGTLFLIGAFLVLVNTWWKNMRSHIMSALPNFPGKSKLHSWENAQ